MAHTSAPPETPAGRVVTVETLTAAPAIVGQPLAEPWRRLAGIATDLTLVTALSILSRPWLGLATGAMLLVLFGNSATAPFPLKVVRTFCRGLGGALILLSALALGHVSLLRSSGFHLEALTGRPPSVAMREIIYVAPEAGAGELRNAVPRLQQQVDDLKKEVRDWQRASNSWLYQVRTLSSALGITFGWSGIYFTLFAGALAGRTPGKLLFRTRATKVNGQPFTFFDAFVRHGGYVAGVAMGMTGFLNLLWDANRRAVEDRIAGTVVLKV
jgi:hypothetical protein